MPYAKRREEARQQSQLVVLTCAIGIVLIVLWSLIW